MRSAERSGGEAMPSFYRRRRTKIIATLGPASYEERVLKRLVKEGVDCFRLNFAHEDYEAKREAIELVREVEEELGTHIPIVGDLQGPVVRLGELEDLPVSRGEKVYLVEGERGDSSAREIPLPCRIAFDEMREGDVVLIEGGRIRLRVDYAGYRSAECTVLTDGVVRSRKTFAIEGKELPLPTITEKDVRDVDFSIEHELDYIALSFVRSAGDLEALRGILRKRGAEDIRIVAKIETRSAVERLEEIARASDVVLVARGDLAIYFGLEEIPDIQEEIVETARAYGKPVVLATQIMESMIENPVPTRSEVLDIVHAVREGVDALMLAGETAVGKYPVESVAWLCKIVAKAEEEAPEEVEARSEDIYDKFARGVVILSELLGAKIVAFSRRGNTARRISRYRPKSDVYVFTPSRRVARQVRLLWGVEPHLYTGESEGLPLLEIVGELKKIGKLSYGDLVVATAGLKEGATDLIRIMKI